MNYSRYESINEDRIQDRNKFLKVLRNNVEETESFLYDILNDFTKSRSRFGGRSALGGGDGVDVLLEFYAKDILDLTKYVLKNIRAYYKTPNTIDEFYLDGVYIALFPAIFERYSSLDISKLLFNFMDLSKVDYTPEAEIIMNSHGKKSMGCILKIYLDLCQSILIHSIDPKSLGNPRLVKLIRDILHNLQNRLN